MKLDLGTNHKLGITSKELLVKVDKNNPYCVTEVLTGIEIPVVFDCRIKLLSDEQERKEKIKKQISPIAVLVEVEITEKKDKTLKCYAYFKGENNINIAKRSKEEQERIFRAYNFYHSDISSYREELEDSKNKGLEEYYRYLKEKYNYTENEKNKVKTITPQI